MQVKHKVDGSETRIPLELWRQTANVVVGRWVAPEDNPYGLTPGCYSWGVWPLGKRHAWAAYRIHDQAGNLKNYRFDAVLKSSADQPDEVEFWDLLLDANVTKRDEGREASAWNVEFEDIEEVQAALEADLLSDEQQASIAKFRHSLRNDLVNVLAHVDREIALAEQDQNDSK